MGPAPHPTNAKTAKESKGTAEGFREEEEKVAGAMIDRVYLIFHRPDVPSCTNCQCNCGLSRPHVTERGTENPLLQCQTECEAVQAARKPNFVLDDHSSRRRLAATLKQPTRRFRPLASLRKPALHDPGRDGPSRAGRIRGGGQTPCLFGLAPCGVYRAIGVTTNAVGSYPAVSPLPSITYAVESAVYFLLHWPSTRLATRIPDVIRHTALRSSDFPPPPDPPFRRTPRGRQRSSGRLHVFSVAGATVLSQAGVGVRPFSHRGPGRFSVRGRMEPVGGVVRRCEDALWSGSNRVVGCE
jgi:hypothetical protein